MNDLFMCIYIIIFSSSKACLTCVPQGGEDAVGDVHRIGIITHHRCQGLAPRRVLAVSDDDVTVMRCRSIALHHLPTAVLTRDAQHD